MSKLNPNAQKWVDALRSRKYQQAQGHLRNGDSFCCLGVACDISGIGTWTEYGYTINHYGNNNLLPKEVRNWLGLKDNAGGHDIGTPQATHLAWENDHGTTFEQIADVIEANADELGVSA
jgi:hypothetical protein